jgi:molecular chaperone IbpA
MHTLSKYNSINLEKFVNDIQKYSIGMDEWMSRMSSLHQTETNYPPYNVIQESNVDFRVEVALAGFKKNQISVYTENNKLFIEGIRETNSEKEYVYHGLSNRAFTRAWTISDDVEVKEVNFEDGLLTVKLSKIVPEHQKKKVWF